VVDLCYLSSWSMALPLPSLFFLLGDYRSIGEATTHKHTAVSSPQSTHQLPHQEPLIAGIRLRRQRAPAYVINSTDSYSRTCLTDQCNADRVCLTHPQQPLSLPESCTSHSGPQLRGWSFAGRGCFLRRRHPYHCYAPNVNATFGMGTCRNLNMLLRKVRGWHSNSAVGYYFALGCCFDASGYWTATHPTRHDGSPGSSSLISIFRISGVESVCRARNVFRRGLCDIMRLVPPPSHAHG
jgi:hypothetical protein